MSYLKHGAEVPTKGKGSKLSALMLRFVEEYQVDWNASKAVLRAGYKTKNPNRVGTSLLQHPLIQKELEAQTELRKEKMEFSADFLLTKLMAIINDPEVKTNDILRAIELAGKSIALWKERQEISGPDGEAIKMEQRVKEDVAKLTSKLASLAARGGTGTVTEFPKPGSSSSS